MEVEASRTPNSEISFSWQPGSSRQTIPEPIHFVGIGGIGMSALARLMLSRGALVSGSDKGQSPITEELRQLGARIFAGHEAANVETAGSIVVSTAITADNPELTRARELGLPVLHRSQLLKFLSSQSRVIAVSGTHGKTTTTGMVAQLLLDAGLDPTVVVGGIFDRVGSNAHAGKGEHFVLEADESDRTHAHMSSEIALVTNIECDHLENYPGGLEQILGTMAEFANSSRTALVCLDDAGCRALLDRLERKPLTYGTLEASPAADYTLSSSGSTYSVRRRGTELGRVTLKVPGKHNQLNSLAALAVALELGTPFDRAAESLALFSGVARRFQTLGSKRGVTVIDDYGHHPTEVKATLEAAQHYKRMRNAKGRVVALFQPHQPGRLRDLWDDFCGSFSHADLVLIADVYIARGGQIPGIDSRRFAGEIAHENVHYVDGPVSGLPAKVLPYLQDGDIFLTIGAGDITSVGEPLLRLLGGE